MKSIFTNKEISPSTKDLKKALGETFVLLEEIVNFTQKTKPDAKEEWKYSSEKYGWSFRISDKKRVIIYLLPRDKFFKVALLFGQKAVDTILKSDISEKNKTEIKNAKVYAEGRGIRMDVMDAAILSDIKKLTTIKINN